MDTLTWLSLGLLTLAVGFIAGILIVVI